MVIFLRRLVLAAAAIGMVICGVLLLNFTAPNPTHRRYSSETVPIEGTAYQLGTRGENAVARDLKQPVNSASASSWRVCRSSEKNYPRCIAYLESVDAHEINHRRPDFYVQGEYIAEVKNWKTETWETWSAYNIHDQVSDFAQAAKINKIPFWLFVRTNTRVPDEIDDLVEATGGDVIYYLAVPGYSDPVDRAAERGLAACGAAAAGLLMWELRVHRRLAALRGPRLRPGRARVTGPRAPIDDAEQLLYRVKSRADRLRAPDEPPDPPGEPPPA